MKITTIVRENQAVQPLIKRILTNDLAWALILSLLVVVLIALSQSSASPVLLAMRAALGLVFILFIPGYSLQAAAYPSRNDLEGKQRIALSFGLSLAVVPAVALILEYLPWKISLWPVTVAYLVFVVLLLGTAAFRRSRLSPAEGESPLVGLDLPRRWVSLDRPIKLAYGFTAFAVIAFAVTAFSVLTSPRPSNYFTEFYILGAEGRPDTYPREGTAGEALEVTVGIHSLESAPFAYRVEARDALGVIGQLPPVQLEPGGSSERVLSFIPQQVGDSVEITLELYRGDAAAPYRTLRMWIAVRPRQ